MIPVHCKHDALVEPAALIPHPRNPNKHPDKQVAILATVIRSQGWRSPIVVSTRSGFVITGHGRLMAGLLIGEPVPVDYQSFENEAQEWAHLVADNRIPELAEIDQGELKQLLHDIKEDDLGELELTGFDSREVEAMLAGIDHEDFGEDKDKSASGVKPDALKVGKLSIEITQEEAEGMRGLAEAYQEAYGSHFGFVTRILAVMNRSENAFDGS